MDFLFLHSSPWSYFFGLSRKPWNWIWNRTGNRPWNWPWSCRAGTRNRVWPRQRAGSSLGLSSREAWRKRWELLICFAFRIHNYSCSRLISCLILTYFNFIFSYFIFLGYTSNGYGPQLGECAHHNVPKINKHYMTHSSLMPSLSDPTLCSRLDLI